MLFKSLSLLFILLICCFIMPGGKTNFKSDWLLKTDAQGNKISSWCKPVKDNTKTAHCFICNKTFRCDNQGLQQVLQHAKTQLHVKLAGSIICGQQLVFTSGPPNNNSTSTAATSQETDVQQLKSTGNLTCFSYKDESLRAELIWSLKVVSSHYSYASCDNIKDTLHAMFPGKIPDDFSMSSSKVSYMVSEATGPHFKKIVVDDVLNSQSMYTIHYDETTNAQIQKQLDIKIRFWSVAQGKVQVHHLQSYLMGHATGAQLSQKLISAIHDNGLTLNCLQMLESDGPNVNKTVWNLVNEQVLQLPEGNHGLIDIGTCNLHIFHNAFAKGLHEFGNELSELVIDIHTWFKLSAARREDYQEVQESLGLPKKYFLKHVDSRWLTLQPALQRICEQIKGLEKYFSEESKKDAKVQSNPRFIRIMRQLNSKETSAKMHFLISVADIFNSFLVNFQKEEPLIHILYDQFVSILKMFLGRFIKQEALNQTDLLKLNLDSSDIQLGDTGIEIGEETRKACASLSADKKKMFMLGVKSFFKASGKHLLKKLPLDNAILKKCRVLNPLNRSADWSSNAIKGLARKLHVDVNITTLCDEWKLYQLDQIPEQWNTSEEQPEKPARVDVYWNKVGTLKDVFGEVKYPQVFKVVKSALILAHGNADVERGFSESGKSVTKERIRLSESSINGIRSTSDGMKAFDNNPSAVPITKELLKLGRFAHSNYVKRLEEERKEKEKREQRAALFEKEKKELEKQTKQRENLQKKGKDLEKKETEQQQEIEIGNKILEEANQKLKEALKNKDFKEAAVAQAMLESGRKKIDDANKLIMTTRERQKNILKRKDGLLKKLLTASSSPTKKREI